MDYDGSIMMHASTMAVGVGVDISGLRSLLGAGRYLGSRYRGRYQR